MCGSNRTFSQPLPCVQQNPTPVLATKLQAFVSLQMHALGIAGPTEPGPMPRRWFSCLHLFIHPFVCLWGSHFWGQVTASHTLSLFFRRKVEDLQFRVEEESITKGDLEVKPCRTQARTWALGAGPVASERPLLPVLPPRNSESLRGGSGRATSLGPEMAFEHLYFLLTVQDRIALSRFWLSFEQPKSSNPEFQKR